MMSDVMVEIAVLVVVHASVAIVQDRPVCNFDRVRVNDCQVWSYYYYYRVLMVEGGCLLMIDGCYCVVHSCSQDWHHGTRMQQCPSKKVMTLSQDCGIG
jgi:hypothetical protein